MLFNCAVCGVNSNGNIAMYVDLITAENKYEARAEIQAIYREEYPDVDMDITIVDVVKPKLNAIHLTECHIELETQQVLDEC
jgi:uncharacterized iron-regulated protein